MEDGSDKRYDVAAVLVRNPRTPVEFALSLLLRLNPDDMRAVANDPELVRIVIAPRPGLG